MKTKIDPRLELAKHASAAVKKKFRKGVSGSADVLIREPSVWCSFRNHTLDLLSRGRLPGGVPVGPQGRIIHIAGKYATAKSALLDHLFLSCLEQGGMCIVSEAEGARSPHYAKAIGLDTRLIHVQRPPDFEHLFDMGLLWIRNIRAEEDERQKSIPMHERVYIPILWGLDSIKAMEAERTAKQGLTEGHGFAYGGGVSQVLDWGIKKVIREAEIHPTTFVMLNQTRVNPMVLFGSKDTTPGGNPPHFYSSLELMLMPAARKGGSIKYGEYHGAPLTAQQRKALDMPPNERGDPIGLWVKAKVTKTRFGKTVNKEGTFYLDFDKGLDPVSGLLQYLLEQGTLRLGEGKQIIHRLPDKKKRTFPNRAAWEQWIRENGMPEMRIHV